MTSRMSAWHRDLGVSSFTRCRIRCAEDRDGHRCRLHFMLRPACLPPVARLSPPGGFSTPRSGAGVSPRHLGPATRRSDAYRGGTSTRWKSAARIGAGRRQLLFVTAHHAGEHRPDPALRRAFGSGDTRKATSPMRNVHDPGRCDLREDGGAFTARPSLTRGGCRLSARSRGGRASLVAGDQSARGQ